MEITFNVTELFFDRAAVQERVGKGRSRAMKVIGAYIRRTARDLQRRSKRKSADPGQPPKAHSPEPNLRTVLFFLDPATDSMVAGPPKLNAKLKSDADTVPQLMEQGGQAEIAEYSPDGGKTWMPFSETTKVKHRGKRLIRRNRDHEVSVVLSAEVDGEQVDTDLQCKVKIQGGGTYHPSIKAPADHLLAILWSYLPQTVRLQLAIDLPKQYEEDRTLPEVDPDHLTAIKKLTQRLTARGPAKPKAGSVNATRI